MLVCNGEMMLQVERPPLELISESDVSRMIVTFASARSSGKPQIDQISDAPCGGDSHDVFGLFASAN